MSGKTLLSETGVSLYSFIPAAIGLNAYLFATSNPNLARPAALTYGFKAAAPDIP